jgi:ABC-type transporter Mla MlaB component
MPTPNIPIAGVKLSGATITLSGPVTFGSAGKLSQQLAGLLSAHVEKENHFTDLTLDCQGVTESDSTLVSLLLEARRLCDSCDLNLTVTHLSVGMESLVALYGMEWLRPVS